MALIDNIKSYWKLDGNSNDSVTTNNGTDLNITYSAANGKIVQGAGFAGNGHSLFPDNFKPTTTAFSISMWIKTAVGSGQGALFNNYEGSAGNKGYYTSINGSGYPQFDIFSAGTNQLIVNVDIRDGNWHHLVFLWDAAATTKMITYLDNTQYLGNAVAGPIENATTHYPGIGSCKYAAGSEFLYFTGAIDEVGFWDKGLISSEVSSLYNSGNGFTYPFSTASSSESPSASPSSSASPSASPSVSPSVSPSISPSASTSPSPSPAPEIDISGSYTIIGSISVLKL